jgi:hypothetical protein
MPKKFTIDDMETFASRAWGELGIGIVRRWAEFNKRYFGGKLHPIPIIITPTLPFGKRLADCWSDVEPGRGLIRLNVPRVGGHLVADNNTLLHEMVHQVLFERGENAKHAGEGWRREIMRLNRLITGREIWAGRSITRRVEGADGKLSKVIRLNEPRADGTESLSQMQIAHWPHDGCGIDLGHLGSETPSPMLRKARRH